MTANTNLDRFYDLPDSVVAQLRGGPFDDTERPFPTSLLQDTRPTLVCAVPPPLLAPIPGVSKPPRKQQHAVYVALRNTAGYLSRDDAGRIRFDFWGLRWV